MIKGVYLVTNKIEETKFLVYFDGVEPFLRIENAISIQDFANGKIQKDYEVISNIAENPSNFTFEVYSTIVKETTVSKSDIKISSKDYKLFTVKDYIDPDTAELKKNLVKSHIMARYNVDDTEAERLFDIVDTKYNAEDRWKHMKIKKECSTSEANSVVN